MIIDTPDDGPPLVHAVKTGCVLDGKVELGDVLMAVNDQNVMDWSAVQVSKYIAGRSDRRRTLVLWRQNPRKRTESSIMLKGDGVWVSQSVRERADQTARTAIDGPIYSHHHHHWRRIIAQLSASSVCLACG
jgi:hypothetical protein